MKHYFVSLISMLAEDSKENSYLVIAESLNEAGKLAVMLESPDPYNLQEKGSIFVEQDGSCSYIVNSVQEVEQSDVPTLSKYFMPLMKSLLT